MNNKTTIGSVVFGPMWDKRTAVGSGDGGTFIPQPVYRHEMVKLLVEIEELKSRVVTQHGCICPPGSEATCQGLGCPRRGVKFP